MQTSQAKNIDLFPSLLSGIRNPYASNEIETKRRRKGPGPQGRAEAPVRPGSGGSSGGGLGGGIPGGGDWQPTSGGSRGSGPKIPLWMIILVVVVLLIFGGTGTLGDLFGGGTDTGGTENQTGDTGYDTGITEEPTVPQVGFTPPVTSKEGSWTVMLYQDADDQVLEQDIFTDLNEAELIGSTQNVNIVAQIDRYRGAYSGDGNWTSTRRYYVTQDSDLNSIHSQLAGDLGEVSMSDPATLVDFAAWAAKTFPADHYVLILSDHGMGWPGGWTDPTPASRASESAPLAEMIDNAMFLDQMDSALAQIQQQTGIAKFDIIGLDACLMGQLEVLDVLEPYARYAITSQETEPSLGWAYASFLQALVQNPGMSAEDLSKLVVQSYISGDMRIQDDQARAEYVSQMGGGWTSATQLANMIGKDATLAVVDLAKVPALMSSVNDLAYAMQGADQSDIAKARNFALSFTSVFGKSVPPSYIDLGSFVQILNEQTHDSTVQQLASQVLTSIKQAVVAEKHGSSRSGATGVAIYYPNSTLYRSAYSGPQSYTVIAKRFTQDSLWDDFLAYHYNNRVFDSATREAVIPPSGLPSRAPGAGQIDVSNLRFSSTSAAPGEPVTMRADVSGTNIGNIYLFVGYYDYTSNSIYVADTDFLESPDTQVVDGVYYPKWGEGVDFTLKFDWDPIVFTISDGQTTTMTLFTPQQYGASAADAVYSVDGIYTFASSNEELSARLNFRDGQLISVFGISGTNDTGAPHQITPQSGDTFTLIDKWLQLDTTGKVTATDYFTSETVLVFGDQPFTWGETYAPQGSYILGFIVTDLDGNSKEIYDQLTVN